MDAGKVIEHLRLEEITFAYKGADPVFEEISFEFPMEKIVRLHGMGGSGKSTLLKIMGALVLPQSGQYFINDLDVSEMSFEEFLPYRLKFGYVPDYGGLLSNKTLRQNLMLPLNYHKSSDFDEWKSWVDKLMLLLEITPYSDSRPASVTNAVRRSACVVRAFVLKPEILLLDNPTDGLSKDQEQAINYLIEKGFEEGWLKHVFIASQDDEYFTNLDATIVELKETRLVCRKPRKKATA